MKILIGTKNPGKIEGAKQAFEKYFENVEIEGIAVNSEVGDQPFNEEILQGAKNRVENLKKYAKENELEIDFYVASEAGLTNSLGEWIDINCVFIENNEGLQSIGTSQGFPIPDKYIEEIKETELGKVYVKAEIQIRTMAMDFWASLEHELKYKNSNITKAASKKLLKAAKVMKKLDT